MYMYEASYYKVVMAGDTGCGKTSLIYRHRYDVFSRNTSSTIGGEYSILPIISPSGQELKMHIWDTAGQEKYRSLVRMYYRGAYAIVFVFDITRIETLRNILSWYREYDCGLYDRVQLFLVGNKCDLLEGEAESPEMLRLIKTYVSEYNFRYVKTSAKDGTGINILFDDIIARIGSDYDCNHNKNIASNLHLQLAPETEPQSSRWRNPCC